MADKSIFDAPKAGALESQQDANFAKREHLLNVAMETIVNKMSDSKLSAEELVGLAKAADNLAITFFADRHAGKVIDTADKGNRRMTDELKKLRGKDDKPWDGEE